MTNKEIIESFSSYEKEQPVETYLCYDWNIWPLMRSLLLHEVTFKSSGVFRFGEKRVVQLLKQSRLVWRFEKLGKALLSKFYYKINKNVDLCNRQNHIDPCSDIVILTSSVFRQQVGECLHEKHSDALVELLHLKGLKTLTWESGKECSPRCCPSALISSFLSSELLKSEQVKPLPRPLWFENYEIFSSSLLGRTVSWAEVEAQVQHTQRCSLIFEKWLKINAAKLVIVVCWYKYETMAATLAARRLGLITADLQHGLQGSSHMAYSGWVNNSLRVYEVVPDVFMSWGKESAQRVMLDNQAFRSQSTSIVTGNLWLNKWRDGNLKNYDYREDNLKRLLKNKTKVILITLQNRFCCEKFVIDAMLNSPDDWFWLVRFHPSTLPRERNIIKKMLSVISKTKYEYLITSSLSLYSVFQFVHIHLTGYSTTALEALSFGIPTITLTRVGADFFKDFIELGVMQYASGASELLNKIILCEKISVETCREAAEDIFASSNVAAAGIDSLLLLAGLIPSNVNDTEFK